MNEMPEAKRPRLEVGMATGPDRIYVERPEDAILLERMHAGQWTNVVAPPTMGKTSMFFRILRQLQSKDCLIACADIDLDSREEVKQMEDPIEMFISIIRRLHNDFQSNTRTDRIEMYHKYESTRTVLQKKMKCRML